MVTYLGKEVVLMEKTAFLKNGGCLKVDVYRIDEFTPDGTPPIQNPVCFEALVFESEKVKDRQRRELIEALKPKKAKKGSKKTNGCRKRK
jgi:hypothetical protein